jgi:Zn-dependent alcohol dehydrogenase
MTGAGSVLNGVGDVGGRSVAVWGVGGVGLASVGAAHALGADQVIAVDINPEKLGVAKTMGATHTIDAREEDAVEVIRELTGGVGVDYGFDCTGVGPNVEKSLGAVRAGVDGRTAGGSLVLVGAPRAPFEFNGMELLSKSKSMVGVLGGLCSPERDFQTFGEWTTSGKLNLDALVTARYSLDEINVGVGELRCGAVLGRAVVEL